MLSFIAFLVHSASLIFHPNIRCLTVADDPHLAFEIYPSVIIANQKVLTGLAGLSSNGAV